MSPNILWIVLDALRVDHVSCYGYDRQTTPNIDALAREGVIYERAYSAAGWSLPSHSSMFTGLYPSKHGAHDENHFLSDRYPTLPELLGREGYQTSFFCNNPWVGTDFGVSRGVQHVEDTLPRGTGVKRKIHRILSKIWKIVTNTNDGGAYQITKRALRWLRKQESADSPFFAFVHYNEPHRKYRKQRIIQRKFTEGVSVLEALKVNQDHDAYIARAVEMTERDFEVLQTIYDSQIYHADRHIGKIIAFLRASGKLDNTIVIITADHGENFGEHGLMDHKLCLYETLIHVPLVIRYPAGFTPGMREQRLVQHVDLFPTLIDVLGIDALSVRAELQGVSLVKNQDAQRTHVIAEQAIPNLKALMRFDTFDPQPYNHRLKAISDGHYKYIWASDGQNELYNLQNDPGELVNVIVQNSDKAAEMQTILADWVGSFTPSLPAASLPPVDSAVLDRLARLGYIE